MKRATVIIPNYNGIVYLENCLRALEKNDISLFKVIVVDNGSTDGSEQPEWDTVLEISQIQMGSNTGFCRAVNAGIMASDSKYVILLNNDTVVEPNFVKALIQAMERDTMLFSASAQMRMMKEPERIDDAGDRYNALGWAFARGKGANIQKYTKRVNIFASCAGAAIYRKSILNEIGLFDENHFAYLEDIDIGYRARIFGYANRYEPEAIVYHAGSAVSGSRHNAFKIDLSSRNNVYLLYKNMPMLQIILNLPFLLPGFFIKFLFFAAKGHGRVYARGILKGFYLSASLEGRKNKITFTHKNWKNYFKIQWELWLNIFLRKV